MFAYSRQVRSRTPGAFQLNAGAEPAPGYRLKRLRGRGGFAEVWESSAPDGRTAAALKFMLSSNTSTTARELRSVQSFLPMEHPYMVKTYGVWSLSGYIVVDMELAEATLLDLMMVYHTEFGQHLDPKLLGLYMWQVAEALDFLNARRHLHDGRKVAFQHGDIKPNNVLLVGDVAKLTDYGLSTPTYGPISPCPRAGTLEYAAPEVFQGYLSDTSDQYSFAVTYCVLRSGGYPFPPPPDDVRKSFHRPPPDLSFFAPHEQATLARALSPIPQERFPGCRELMTALLRAQGFGVMRGADGQVHIVPAEETVADTLRNPFSSPSGLHKPQSGTVRAPSGLHRAPLTPSTALPMPPSGTHEPTV